jgi:hypothetical protein
MRDARWPCWLLCLSVLRTDELRLQEAQPRNPLPSTPKGRSLSNPCITTAAHRVGRSRPANRRDGRAGADRCTLLRHNTSSMSGTIGTPLKTDYQRHRRRVPLCVPPLARPRTCLTLNDNRFRTNRGEGLAADWDCYCYSHRPRYRRSRRRIHEGSRTRARFSFNTFGHRQLMD